MYGPEVDVSQMTKGEKISYQAAMRQCHQRQLLAENKKDHRNKR